MQIKHKKLLGVVELNNGTLREVPPMYDLFLNYMFSSREDWETLRIIVNVFLSEYKARNPATDIPLLEGEIVVETQYDYYLSPRKEKRQDMRIASPDNKSVTYVEFQNRTDTVPPISDRALLYFSLGLSLMQPDGVSNQIWLLAEDDNELLVGKAISCFRTLEEEVFTPFPNGSRMMFVSLAQLAETDNVAGELASFLLGSDIMPKHDVTLCVTERFSRKFETFKVDKEVKDKMTRADDLIAQGKAEGKAEGKTEGIILAALRLLQNGSRPEEVIKNLDLKGYESEVFIERAKEQGLILH